MLDFTGFTGCCGLRIAYSIAYGTVEDFLKRWAATASGSNLCVLFADNPLEKPAYPLSQQYTIDHWKKSGISHEGLGGHKLAAGLREKGYRVDEIKTDRGNHGSIIHLWIWWPNKESEEGKKQSRINYVEQRREGVKKTQSTPDSSSKLGSIKRKRVLSRFRGVFGNPV